MGGSQAAVEQVQTEAQPTPGGYPSAPSSGYTAKLPQKCSTEGCNFATTWHATHCCHACAAGQVNHGGRCEQKPFEQRPHCPTEGCRFVVTFHATHCCEPCKHGRGHGPRCEQVAHRKDRCARWLCGREATWHPTHCCQACADGKGHGPKCVLPTDAGRFLLRNRSPLADCRPTASGGQFPSLVYAKAKTAQGAEVDLSLDLQLPAGEGPWPCVVYIHGGAWVRGTFQGFTTGPFGQLLCSLGWACASVQYRFLQDSPWPAAEGDVRAAVRILRKHAAQLRLDPQRFVSMGHSAGGQLAAFLAPAAGRPELDGDLRDVAGEVTSDVQGTITYAGALTGLRKMQGGDVVEIAEASTSSTGWPPALIIQGTEDHLVPEQTAKDFAAALKALKVPAELLILPGHGHQFHLLPAVADAMANFLKQFR